MPPYSTPKRSMVHLNSHLMVAMDLETTGLDPDQNQIWQIAILPLDSKLEVSQELKPFDLLIKPDERKIDKGFKHSSKLADAVERGLDPYAAIELFEHWFQSLNLLPNKRLVPLGANLQFDIQFLRRWLGPLTYSEYFDNRYRDLMLIANFLNDRADFQHMEIPYVPNTKLGTICAKLGLDYDPAAAHDAIYDASKAAEAYRKMLRDYL